MDFEIKAKFRGDIHLYRLQEVYDGSGFDKQYRFGLWVGFVAQIYREFRKFKSYSSLREAIKVAYMEPGFIKSGNFTFVPHPIFDSDLEYFEIDGYRVLSLEFLNFI